MQRFQVIKIQRVENRALWDGYAHFRALMQKRRRTPWQALHNWAWHGTSTNEPQLIADSGVDFRFCERGFWGRGAYTAHNASYSNNYSYKNTTDNTRQMFLVNVMLGHTKDFGPEKQQVLLQFMAVASEWCSLVQLTECSRATSFAGLEEATKRLRLRHRVYEWKRHSCRVRDCPTVPRVLGDLHRGAVNSALKTAHSTAGFRSPPCHLL